MPEIAYRVLGRKPSFDFVLTFGDRRLDHGHIVISIRHPFHVVGSKGSFAVAELRREKPVVCDSGYLFPQQMRVERQRSILLTPAVEDYTWMLANERIESAAQYRGFSLSHFAAIGHGKKNWKSSLRDEATVRPI